MSVSRQTSVSKNVLCRQSNSSNTLLLYSNSTHPQEEQNKHKLVWMHASHSASAHAVKLSLVSHRTWSSCVEESNHQDAVLHRGLIWCNSTNMSVSISASCSSHFGFPCHAMNSLNCLNSLFGFSGIVWALPGYGIALNWFLKQCWAHYVQPTGASFNSALYMAALCTAPA